jgi:uncharacterized protein YgiM (DUF1202 family)
MFTRAVLRRSAVRSHAVRALAGAAAIALWAPAASGESAWIKDELIVNLRSDPKSGADTVQTVKTGDSVEVTKRRGEWAQVRTGRTGEEREGWIQATYLQPGPPATVLLARRQRELDKLSQQVADLTREAEELRKENAELGKQASDVAALQRENTQLRTHRWPEWIAGAAILSVGMIAGRLMAGSGRRKARLRL